MTSATLAPIRATMPLEGRRFDGLVLAASLWLLIGLALDGWAHNSLLPDSFFTPWHGVLYSGYLACAFAITAPIALRQDRAWRQRIPAGYGLAVAGVAIFGVGGALDMVWHLVFGIEVNIEALLSPSHLILFTGIVLMASGPLRADWLRGDHAGSLWNRLPMAFSLAFLMLIGTFISQFVGPFAGMISGEPRPAGDAFGLSVAALFLDRALLGIYLYSALVSGVVVMTLRRTVPPFGMFGLVLLFDAALMTLIGGNF